MTRSAVLTEAVRQLVDQAGLSLDTTASFDAGASLPFDLAVDVASLTEDQLPAQYTEWKAFFLSGHRRLFALYRKDDDVHRAGLRGLFRCAAKEFPDQVIRLIELEPNVDAKQAAKILLAEATDDTCTPIVCYRQATRYKPTLVDDPVTLTPNQPIPEEATWVLIGGARGITAQLAQRLAASANHIALIGRTKEASNESDCRLEKFHSLNEIRGAMLEHGMADTAALATSMARDLLARREIQRTMLSIAEAGCGASYHPTDIADASQIDALLQQIEQHHGRIYGIVHAAGVIEDKLIADKDERSFARVWATKVEGAKNLMAACEKLVHPPTALWMFGSIAALAGNRGQSDYAAANSAMDALGRSWSKGSATRAITMHWGPWAPLGEGHGGMVSTELGRQFAARDIPMIRTGAGVDAFIAELTSNRGDQPSVVYSAGTW